MIPEIKSAEYEGDYNIRIVFTDGVSGRVDLSGDLYGEMFEPLKQPSFFRQVFVHPEFKTLCWPNGADIAPEYLYDMVRGVGVSA
jgi:hypothetical protein